MQKLALYPVILCICLISCKQVCAQDNISKTINVTVSARIISSVELVTVRSMQLSGAEAADGIITVNPLTSSNAGKMVAIGTPDSNIRLSYLRMRALTQQQSSESVMFEYIIAANTKNDQSSAELLNDENRNLRFNGEGQLYLWIGGQVDISSVPPGNYRGEFTVEIEYI